MMIVATDGHIIDAIGPYLADGKNNDASIAKDIFQSINQAEKWFSKDDIFVVDRGFRDSLDFFEENSFLTKMPAFNKNQKQHTTKEANETRIITSMRWVVESANGRIKRWEYLNNIVQNKSIPFLEMDFRFVCALVNRYRPQLRQDKETDAVDARKMLELSKKENDLISYVDKFSKRKSKSTVCTDLNSLKFPKLSVDYIRKLSWGIFQLKNVIF